jgi:hypothetical protein
VTTPPPEAASSAPAGMSPIGSTTDSASLRARISFKTLLLMLCLIGLLAWPALAAMTVEERQRFRCFGCHTGNAKPFVHPRTGERKEILIDIGAQRAAAHGDLACQECHVKGFEIFPHSGKTSLGCMECHPREGADAKADATYDFPRIEREFESSAHFARHPEKFGCEQCHHPHYFEATVDLGSPQAILDVHNAWCRTCHAENPEQPPDTIASGLADPAEPDLVAEHAMIPHAAIHLRKSRCVDCHSGPEQTVSHTLPARGEAGGCVWCHALDSVHARLYRYVGGVREASGFTNPAIMRASYVMGATRYVPLDVLAYLLVGGALLTVLAHAAMRVVRRLPATPGRQRRAGR